MIGPLALTTNARPMVDKAFVWAEGKGLVRKNAIHGEDEARLVLEDFFGSNNERGEMTHAQAEGEVED